MLLLKTLFQCKISIDHGNAFGGCEDEARDVCIDIPAANAETQAAVKPIKRVSGLINFFNEWSTAGYKNSMVIEKEFADTPAAEPPHWVPSLEILNTIGKMTSKISHTREKLTEEVSHAPKLQQNMVKVVDPPWYKPVVSVAASGMNRMKRQEAQASAPVSKKEKIHKACSSTEQRLPTDMFSLGSSFSTSDMANLLMRLSLMLMFTASPPEPKNKL